MCRNLLPLLVRSFNAHPVGFHSQVYENWMLQLSLLNLSTVVFLTLCCFTLLHQPSSVVGDYLLLSLITVRFDLSSTRARVSAVGEKWSRGRA